MPWYVVYRAPDMRFREGELPVTGITKPISSEIDALLRGGELEDEGNIVLDVFNSASLDPLDAMKEYHEGERRIKSNMRFGRN